MSLPQLILQLTNFKNALYHVWLFITILILRIKEISSILCTYLCSSHVHFVWCRFPQIYNNSWLYFPNRLCGMRKLSRNSISLHGQCKRMRFNRKRLGGGPLNIIAYKYFSWPITISREEPSILLTGDISLHIFMS